MGHSPIIIDDIERLQQEAGPGQLSDALDEFNSKYVDANALLNRSPAIPPFHAEIIHALLEDIEKWIKKAHVADTDFEVKFTYYRDQMDYWLVYYS